MNLSSKRRFGFISLDRFFSFTDSLKPSDRLVFKVLFYIFAISALIGLFLLSRGFLTNVPASGGVLIEGAIGAPRFINPVLAITRADNDLLALTHSGLMRLSPDGTLVNDLAESVTISEDGLVYNVVMRTDRRWHDNTPVTAEDVAFTIALIQKPEVKSPILGNWSGVTVELIGKHEINFVLENPYTPFIENLTVGILPKHVWDTLSDEEFPFSHRNIEPIGSGPYKVHAVKRTPAGLISEYDLRVADDYKDEANIKRVIVRYYQNEDAVLSALNKGEINATASLSERHLSSLDRDLFKLMSEPLPRVFSVFYNQNKATVLRDKAVRDALDVSIDRAELVKRAVDGYGRPTNTPLPPGWANLEDTVSDDQYGSNEERLNAARDMLRAAGWRQNTTGRWEKTIDEVVMPLAFTVRSANGPLFEKIASYLTETWQTLGVDVTVELYEQSDLVQTIIRPRDYQALLFGVDVGRSLDLYPFWHSSGREDPGLNVSLYANITIDRLVTDMRVATSTETRDTLIGQFVQEIDTEHPATFLFTPSFEYVLRSNIRVTDMKRLQKPSERFLNISEWHMNESGVWPIFNNN